MNTVHPETASATPSVTSLRTYGEKAVGMGFNPSGHEAVDMCKSGHAILIDQMNDLRLTSTDPEVKRMASVAITEMQAAQMWAVKALTWR